MVFPRVFGKAAAQATGKRSAKQFWRVVRAGFPVVQAVPKETAAVRTSYSSDFLYTLTTDEVRMRAFREAIQKRRAERVLEVGCGPWAPLADMALSSGAREVVAVEATPQHAQAARRYLEERRGTASVTVLAGRASDVELPEGFWPDLVIGELLGYTASEEGAPAIFAEVHERLGAARRGEEWHLPSVLPQAARSLLMPVRPLKLSCWHALRNWHAHGWWPKLLPGHLYDCRNFPQHLELPVAPQVWEEFNFSDPGLAQQLQQTRQLEFALPSGTEVGGLLLWMQTDVDDTASIDTRRDFTSWNHYYLHLPVQCVPGDGQLIVHAEVDARTEDVRYRFRMGDASFDSHE